MYGNTFHGNREVPDLTSAWVTEVCPKNQRGHARDIQIWEVGQPHNTKGAPNKSFGAPGLAEVVEERGLTKGNLFEQIRVWTQGQAALQNAFR